MKIAIDIREAGQGKTGKGWYNFSLVEAILKQDPNNQYLLYANAPSSAATGKSGSAANPKSPFAHHKNVTIKNITARSFAWHYQVLKDLKAEKVDLFFAPTSYIIPALAPKSIKTIITVHDMVAFLYPSSHSLKAVLIERLTLRKALKKTSAVFVVSENTKKDLLKKFKYPESRIYLTYCAPSEFFKQEITAKDLETVRKKLKLPEKFVLAVGTLEPRKNFANLIKSFVIIKRKHPDFKLVIVGKKGWKFDSIEEALKQYKLENEVIFPGYLEDSELQKVYRLATVFVFPSLYEGFGIPPLEAMLSGCPVVSSNVASLPEVIGEAGLLIDPRNALKIADAVSSLITDEHVRNTLIEKGKANAARFSWEESAKKALEVFNS